MPISLLVGTKSKNKFCDFSMRENAPCPDRVSYDSYQKNETCVLYCSSKTIAAGAFSQANHQLYYLWAWKWGIVCLCKPKIVGNMSKNVRIGICENSAFCKK